MKWQKFISQFLVGIMVVAGVELGMYAVKSSQAGSEQFTSSQAQAETPAQSPAFTVSHQVKGDALHITLTVQKFAFSLENMGKENKYGEGHVHLYVDGKKVAKIFEPYFVYSGLTKGSHQITLELAHNNHESYGVKKMFEIQVH
ncbi:hypothetical protein ACQCN2_16660 [Brevibacillus ginsengisoli]|uniref:hypothetical protein n=1 Tax=Brevibacillus ginsengisoli TaxID=363854 RepID=UPI003CF64F46